LVKVTEGGTRLANVHQNEGEREQKRNKTE